MMDDMNYLVYDGGSLVGGFVSLAVAVNFAESWRFDSEIGVDLVDAHTGEVVDTWINGTWENGN